MPEQPHRYAAIMFTDIVGYTALMGLDEDKALEVLRRNQEIHKACISQFNGTLIKEMGDGMLISFNLASEAVRCAIGLQKASKEQDIPLKIGIHQGEVVFADADVLGDGVNIASRLQENGQAGSITISGKVNSDVKNRSGIQTWFVEEKTFKNVDEPIKVYHVLGDGEEIKEQERPTGEVWKKSNRKNLIYLGALAVVVIAAFMIWNYRPADKQGEMDKEKSIAVIPFWNDSPDPDNAYFCSGMEEEIRIHLMKIGDLSLESRQSVEKYRQNPEKDLITIGKELGVAYIVEGSVRKVQNDIRITVQLIDAASGNHIWGETYDGDYTQELLKFQASTAMQIANALNAAIKPEEEERIERLPTLIIAAYDLRIRGNFEFHEYWRTFDKKYAQYGHQLLDSAINIDPELIEAYIGKADIYVAEGKFDSVLIYTSKAMKMDPENGTIYELNGRSYFFQRKYELSVDNYLKAIDLTPHEDPILINELGRSYGWQKNGTELAYQQFNKAYHLKQTNPEQLYFYIAVNYTHTGDYENAKKYFLKNISNRERVPESSNIGLYAWSLIVQNKNDEAISFLDSTCQVYNYPLQCEKFRFDAYLIRKDFESASSYLKKLMALGTGSDQWQFGDQRWGWWMMDNIYLAYFYYETGEKEQASILLKETQISLEKLLTQDHSYVPHLNLSAIHAIRKEKEQALQYLSEAIDAGLMAGWHDLISTHPVFENLWDTPQFKILLKRAREEKAKDRARINAMRDAKELDI